MSGEGLIHGARLIEAPLQFQLKSGHGKSLSRALVICPKCDGPCFIRDSQRKSEQVKHLICHCTNTGCGHTFLAELAFVHSFNPGLIDRPDLGLKVCPRDQVPHILPPCRDGPDDENQMSMFGG
ncbi:Ogr/Delta-like zinc finger [Novosphingobium sp. CF614]|uniref:ogr/Delta-like zinc finger family protein n=1 Tax=Novosphingobium sp. CF614 TaxID=1884364 RepID=UPI0008EF6DFF|nr:ogr/Delta-like zinc finger family protein [Novosphingobium sp. CF614]SFG08944.1 Ogr/Delta-like zinc finger [Novosphingobium sp. CF614]